MGTIKYGRVEDGKKGQIALADEKRVVFMDNLLGTIRLQSERRWQKRSRILFERAPGAEHSAGASKEFAATGRQAYDISRNKR